MQSLTAYIGEPEALRQSRAVGLRVKVEPHRTSGGDERRRQGRAAYAVLVFPRGAEQQPVSPTSPRLLHVKTVEAAAQHGAGN